MVCTDPIGTLIQGIVSIEIIQGVYKQTYVHTPGNKSSVYMGICLALGSWQLVYFV